MKPTSRCALTIMTVSLVGVPAIFGQQGGSPGQVAPQQAATPPGAQAPGQSPVVQVAPPVQPPGFQLNALQQADLDQMLLTWQQRSGQINTFKCDFDRWEYNLTFGPGPNIPLHQNKGQLSFGRPDKGSFQITAIHTWKEAAVPPGQPAPQEKKGDWVHQPGAIGEHWVCDGKSVFEYRHEQKHLVERPIPPQMRGQAIVDGPLPFLFGAEANKLKARYWMRLEPPPNNTQIWLVALPKFQTDAADFKAVEVILDRQQMLPQYMQVHLPNGDRHMYTFDVANATMNGRFEALKNFFQLPRLPVGWKRIVEPMPMLQAAQPAALPQR
jgi:TIGR03009 family protein